MPPTNALASGTCLAAFAARRAPRGRVPSRSRIPRAGTNDASEVVGKVDIGNDPMPADARREPRKAVRLARRAVLAAPPALVAVAAVRTADAAVEASTSAAPKPGEWGYADFETGPLRWGEVRDASGARAFPDCGCAACAQSPIDISSSRANRGAFAEGSLADVAVPAKGAVTVAVAQKHGTPNYALVETATRRADASGLDASGGVALDGVPYAFSSLHFHTPAENTLDGAANAMEMHLVHFAADGSGAVAVLGVLFEYAAEERPADATAERLLADVAADGGARRIKINPGALWDGTSGYFRWQGSLTTPPCTGGVSWVLQKETRTVSREAVARFREHLGDGAFPGNARPTQPLNGRTVRVFEPKSA